MAIMHVRIPTIRITRPARKRSGAMRPTIKGQWMPLGGRQARALEAPIIAATGKDVGRPTCELIGGMKNRTSRLMLSRCCCCLAGGTPAATSRRLRIDLHANSLPVAFSVASRTSPKPPEQIHEFKEQTRACGCALYACVGPPLQSTRRPTRYSCGRAVLEVSMPSAHTRLGQQIYSVRNIRGNARMRAYAPRRS